MTTSHDRLYYSSPPVVILVSDPNTTDVLDSTVAGVGSTQRIELAEPRTAFNVALDWLAPPPDQQHR